MHAVASSAASKERLQVASVEITEARNPLANKRSIDAAVLSDIRPTGQFVGSET
jgi:hypothetical protein